MSRGRRPRTSGDSKDPTCGLRHSRNCALLPFAGSRSSAGSPSACCGRGRCRSAHLKIFSTRPSPVTRSPSPRSCGTPESRTPTRSRACARTVTAACLRFCSWNPARARGGCVVLWGVDEAATTGVTGFGARCVEVGPHARLRIPEAEQPSQDGFASCPTIAACYCVALLGRPLKALNLQHPAANRPNVSGMHAASERPYHRAGSYKRHRAGVAPMSEADASGVSPK